MKLIDELKWSEKENCPHCCIGQLSSGLGVFWCKQQLSSLPYSLIYGAGNEACSIKDWEVCPLNNSKPSVERTQ